MKLLGISTIILGILAIATPLVAGASIVLLIGLLVIAGGFARIAWAFRAETYGKGLLGFAIGGMTLLCGIVLVTNPILASGVLTIILALYLLTDGVFEAIAAFRLRPAYGWKWLLTGGTVSCILGVMIWRQFPLSGAWAIGLLLGIKLVLVGMIMIVLSSATQRNI